MRSFFIFFFQTLFPLVSFGIRSRSTSSKLFQPPRICTEIKIAKSIRQHAIHSNYISSENIIGRCEQLEKRCFCHRESTDSSYTIKCEDTVFNKMEGRTYLQIGSDPNTFHTQDCHLFDGNGIVHGIFFQKNQLIISRHLIETKRLLTESRLNKKVYLTLAELRGVLGFLKIVRHSIYEQLKIIPEARGTANTAILSWNGRIFALHESDSPYELSINFSTGSIKTIGHVRMGNLKSVTAHPKISKDKKHLYLYSYNNYDFREGRFFYNILKENMKPKVQVSHRLVNNGIIHDIGETEDHFIVPDLPLCYDTKTIFKGKIPFVFDIFGITQFGIFPKENPQEIQWYRSYENMFIFHFSKCYENKNEFIVFSCNSNQLDMMTLLRKNPSVKGNIRFQMMFLDKKSQEVEVIKNAYLESLSSFSRVNIDFQYNLDFPFYRDHHDEAGDLIMTDFYCLIYNMECLRIEGIMRMELNMSSDKNKRASLKYQFKNNVPQIYLFREKFPCAEPQLIIEEERDLLLCFSHNENKTKSYTSVIELKKQSASSFHIELPANITIPGGFHSVLL